MIKIILTDVQKTIINNKGLLVATGAKIAERLGIVNSRRMIEEKMAEKIRETLTKEGIVARVEISDE